MSNYTKTVDFAAKDSLPSGDSGKIIKGTEFETEFDNISTAIATKSDSAGPTFTGVLTFASLKGTGATTVTTILDEDDMSTDSATALATQQSIKAYVDAQQDTVDTLAEILALGNATGGTDIAFGDNDKAIFGDGSDLQIYSDGTTGQVTGNVNVTGTVTADGLTSSGDVTLGSGASLQIDDQDSLLFGTFALGSSGTLLQGGTSVAFDTFVGGKKRHTIASNGDLYCMRTRARLQSWCGRVLMNGWVLVLVRLLSLFMYKKVLLA